MKTKIKKFFQEYRERANEPELDSKGNPVNQEALLKAICIGGFLTLFCIGGLTLFISLLFQVIE